ncbi:MAG TPA: DUF2163 domain-containing protein [Stellaceae bacterium]|nr:DUF2163 domain-containing protein [Stellaceae bacterium]
MKAAKYEASPGALASFLASRPSAAILCDLYTFALAGAFNGGAPLRYTTADIDVTVPYEAGTALVNTGPPLAAPPLAAGATVWSSQLVYFDQLSNKAYGHWKVGLDVDTWQVICAPSPQATIGGEPFLAALRAGALDGAVVAVDRAFVDNRDGNAPGATLTPLGVVNIFTGRVAEIDIARSNAVISINSHLELLNQSMPRNVYQAGCRWSLFGPGCELDAASFAVTGSVAEMPAANSPLLTVSLAAPGGSGTYALGRVVATSGANQGFARAVRSWSALTPPPRAALTLMAPFPFAFAVGDGIAAYPGCDKQQNTCIAFGNAARFGGMPFIPAPEMAV